MRKKRITIKDVAFKAGVSYQTVSRVLNGSPSVLPETRAKIEQVMKDLNYSPDPIARGLARRQSYTLGIIIATYTGYCCSLMLEGAEEYAREQGYNIVVSGTETHASAEPYNSLLLARQRIEGLLIIYHGSAKDNYRLLANIPADIPIITNGYALDQENIQAIRVDSYKAAVEVTEYLIHDGHRTVAMLTGPRRAYEVEERVQGFFHAHHAAGLEVDEELFSRGDWTIESGYHAMREILEKGKTFTALFAHNDRMAFGAMKALEESGLKVPDDVSIIGFNNHPLSQFSSPMLSTVNYPAMALGQICTDKLIKRVAGTPAEEIVLTEREQRALEPQLIIRDSCRSFN